MQALGPETHTGDAARRRQACKLGESRLTQAAGSTSEDAVVGEGTLSPLAQAEGADPPANRTTYGASRASRGTTRPPRRTPPQESTATSTSRTRSKRTTFPQPKTASPRRTRRRGAAAAQSRRSRVFTRAPGKEGKGVYLAVASRKGNGVQDVADGVANPLTRDFSQGPPTQPAICTARDHHLQIWRREPAGRPRAVTPHHRSIAARAGMGDGPQHRQAPPPTGRRRPLRPRPPPQMPKLSTRSSEAARSPPPPSLAPATAFRRVPLAAARDEGGGEGRGG